MSTSKIIAAGAVVVAAFALGIAVRQSKARRAAENALVNAVRDRAALQAKVAVMNPMPEASGNTGAQGIAGDARGETDFHALAALLRAAGHSPEIVRNVVSDVVGHHFQARRRALGLEQGRDRTEFWKSAVVSGSAGTSEQIAGRRALEQEQRETLRALFGPDYDVSEDARRQRAHGLPPATATRLHQIFADYRDMEEHARAEVKTSAEIRAKLELLAKEKRADIERLLTPEQLLEFDLRMGAGSSLHNRLGSFEVTEAEFRALYAAQKGFNDANPALPARDRVAHFEPEFQRVLGETRYSELLVANQKGAQQSSAFVELRAFVLEHNLSPAAAAEVLRLQNQYQPQLNLISQNPSLTEAQRVANRATLGAVARKELLGVLGPNAFDAYEKQRGGWLPPPAEVGSSTEPCENALIEGEKAKL